MKSKIFIAVIIFVMAISFAVPASALTAAERQTLIDQIQARLASVQAELVSLQQQLLQLLNDTGDTTIACSSASSCGTDGFSGAAFCTDGNVYQSYTTYSCSNPGTTSSVCSAATTSKLKTTCSSNQTCTSGSCVTIITGVEEGCTANWSCSDWTVCSGGYSSYQTRSCYDTNYCNDTANKPNEYKACGAEDETTTTTDEEETTTTEDKVGPSVVSIVTSNGGQTGYIDSGDKIVVTFDKAIDPAFNNKLTKGGTSSGVVYGQTGGVWIASLTGKLTIQNIASFDVGTIKSSVNFVVNLALSSDGKVLTITITSGSAEITKEQFSDAKQIAYTIVNEDGYAMKAGTISSLSGTFGGSINPDVEDETVNLITSVVVANGGRLGYIDSGDTIKVTFSKEVDPKTFNTYLTKGGTVEDVYDVLSATFSKGYIVARNLGGVIQLVQFDVGTLTASKKITSGEVNFLVKLSLDKTGKILTITITAGKVAIASEAFSNATTTFGGIYASGENSVTNIRSLDSMLSGTFGGNVGGDAEDPVSVTKPTVTTDKCSAAKFSIESNSYKLVTGKTYTLKVNAAFTTYSKIGLCSGRSYSVYIDDMNNSNKLIASGKLSSSCQAATGASGNVMYGACSEFKWTVPLDLVSGAHDLIAVVKTSNGDGVSTTSQSFTVSESTATASNCVDSDGSNYWSKGTVTLDNTVKTDTCIGATLTEYYCGEDGLIKSKTFACPSGCNNGTCTTEFAIKDVIVGSSLGGNLAVSWTQKGMDSGKLNLTLVEKSYSISNTNTQALGTEKSSKSYSMATGVPVTDGSYTWVMPTTIRPNVDFYADYITASRRWYYTTDANNYAHKYYISIESDSGAKLISDGFDISYCINRNACCLGGTKFDYYSAATSYAVYNNTLSQTAVDKCTGNVLTDYRCDGNTLKTATYTCANGCSNGACKKETSSSLDYKSLKRGGIYSVHVWLGGFTSTDLSQNLINIYLVSSSGQKYSIFTDVDPYGTEPSNDVSTNRYYRKDWTVSKELPAGSGYRILVEFAGVKNYSSVFYIN